MTEDWSGQIFDSILEEVLTHKHPPDLTDRIVSAWKRECADVLPSIPLIVSGSDPSLKVHHAASPATVSLPTPSAARSRASSLRRRKMWVAPLMSVAASGLLVLASWQYWLFKTGGQSDPIEVQPLARIPAEKSGLPSPAMPKSRVPEVALQPNAIASKAPNPALKITVSPIVKEPARPELTVVESTNSKPESLAVRSSDAIPAAPLADKQIVELIDSQLELLWKRNGVSPTGGLNRIELIVKTCQELTGSTSAAFAPAAPANEKSYQQAQLASTLTESAEFAQHWADRFVSRWLAGTIAARRESEAGKTLRSMLGREIAQHSPWNKVMASLVHPNVLGSNSATISSDIFLTSLTGNKNVRLASRVASHLLDQRSGCAQCHPMTSGDSERIVQQAEFWSLVANLAGLDGRDSNEVPLRLLVDKQGELFASNKHPNVFYELPDGKVQSARAKLPDGTEWNSVESAKTPREALASWLANSAQVDRAIVNQAWHFVFGRPLVSNMPVLDEVGAEEREELLHALAVQFRANNHDLGKLASWLVQSQAFSLRPLAVDRQTWLNANDAEFEKWNTMESTFASAGTLGISTEAKSLETSLAAALKWNGLERAQDRTGLLAQPAVVDKGKKSPAKAPPKGADSTPSRSYLVHASWHTPAQRDYIRRLASSKLSWREQVQHVIALADDYALPANVEKLADQLLAESSENVEIALLQLLWAVRNSAAS